MMTAIKQLFHDLAGRAAHEESTERLRTMVHQQKALQKRLEHVEATLNGEDEWFLVRHKKQNVGG